MTSHKIVYEYLQWKNEPIMFSIALIWRKNSLLKLKEVSNTNNRFSWNNINECFKLVSKWAY